MIEPDGTVVSYAELAAPGRPDRPGPAGARPPPRRLRGRDAAQQLRGPRAVLRRDGDRAVRGAGQLAPGRRRGRLHSRRQRRGRVRGGRAVRRRRDGGGGSGRDRARRQVRGRRRPRVRAAVRPGRRTARAARRRAPRALRWSTRRAPRAAPRACGARSPARTRTAVPAASTWFFGLFGLAPFDGHVHLCCSPLYHTAVLNFATISLQLGHPVVLMDGFDPETMLALIERHRVTHTHMVPTQFRRLLALPEQVRSRVRRQLACAPRSTAPRRARRKSSGR